MYYFLGDLEEDMLHVFRDCPLVMSIWMITIHVQWRSKFFEANLEQWIYLNMNKDIGWCEDNKWDTRQGIACDCI